MADNTVLNPGALGDTIATEDIGGVKYELVKLLFGGNGVATKVDAANPLPVIDAVAEAALTSIASEDFATEVTLAALLAKVITAPSTEAKQDAMIVLLSTIAAITQPLTDTQLRATPVPVSGTVATGGLTDAQLRASAVPISGTVAVTGAGDATAANQSTQITAEQAIQAAVQIMDDWDESDRAKVNLIVGQAGIAAGTGTDGATVPRVTLATNVALPAGTNLLGKTGIDQTTDGTTNKVRATATQKPSIGATVVLAVTALQSMVSSATVGWKSVRTSNLATLATDYEVMISLTTANTAPANDKAMYLFVIPWYTSDAGTTWFASSGGTATLPSSADATYTIASPHNFRLLGVLNYTTQQMVVQDTFLLSNCFGNRLPDGFSFCVINFSGAALSTGCILDITPINDILV